jgi:GNAT superfamily N-acetyltransferase
MTERFSRKLERVVSFRTPSAKDEDFLFALYASTRQEEMDMTGWDEEQRRVFLRLQFEAQRTHYQNYYPDAEHNLLIVEGKPAGRMMIHRNGAETLLVDLALLPTYCNGGIGTYLLKRLLRDEGARGNSVRLHVLKFSRALPLYRRLGFSQLADKGMHVEMIWRQPAPVVKEDSNTQRK